MKANEYVILTRAIEEGVSYGLKRAHKHTDSPTEEAMQQAIEEAVVTSICEVFNFEPIGEDGE